jgi:hypothetical protein
VRPLPSGALDPLGRGTIPHGLGAGDSTPFLLETKQRYRRGAVSRQQRERPVQGVAMPKLEDKAVQWGGISGVGKNGFAGSKAGRCGLPLRGGKAKKSGVCPRGDSPVLARQKTKGLTSL